MASFFHEYTSEAIEVNLWLLETNAGYSVQTKHLLWQQFFSSFHYFFSAFIISQIHSFIHSFIQPFIALWLKCLFFRNASNKTLQKIYRHQYSYVSSRKKSVYHSNVRTLTKNMVIIVYTHAVEYIAFHLKWERTTATNTRLEHQKVRSCCGTDSPMRPSTWSECIKYEENFEPFSTMN